MYPDRQNSEGKGPSERGKQQKQLGKKGEPIIVRVKVPTGRLVLGEVEQLLGERRMQVRCTDGHSRLCRIPGKVRKRIWLHEGDILLVEPWTVQENERGDILLKYTPQQADWLEKKGYLEGLKKEE